MRRIVCILLIVVSAIISIDPAAADENGKITLFKEHLRELAQSRSEKRRKLIRLAISLQCELSSVDLFGPDPLEEKKTIFELVSQAAYANISCCNFALSTLYQDGVKAWEPNNPSKEVILVPRDRNRATSLLVLSSNGGCPSAMRELAIAYSYGHGVLENDRTSATWYQKAALNGDPSSMLQLAFRLFTGKGIKKDQESALAWAMLASENVNGIEPESARKALPEFKSSIKEALTPTGIQRAQDRAIELKKKIERNIDAFTG